MYKGKEWIGVLLLVMIILVGNLIFNFKQKEEVKIENSFSENESFIIQIEGEVVRPMELQYAKPISYGVLFLRIRNNLNEFSNISGFDTSEIISSSISIHIPTYDVGNFYSPNEKIFINQATVNELKKLPQIGEKRAQKILDYIKSNGKIETWDIFFKIVGVPENVKDEIKNQAIL
ncbi:MAG: helix-hairpin-helix domain-containing protein [Anaeroplasmataceae bacterium]|nr:helix-hairpin-helix domain-containing protein [Anaeroplasmataceae bacterium]